MDNDFKRIYEKLDKIADRLNEIDKTLVKQEGNLQKHMLRTDQNEQMIKLISDALKPVVKHVSHVEGGLKLLGVLSLIAGIVLTVSKILY